MTIDLILGTAGHIDHGKTSLIRALTGVETDRLPEEKKRGITIELGFAELIIGDYRMGIVDVPGHEKFVRNMLAGATGMDVAMLVVAADDSIKQQTREHLDILRLLNLPAGLIALTKSDLVDADWLDLVEEEIRDLVQDTFLQDAEIVRTSSKTGAGIDALKEALVRAADRSQQSGRTMSVEAPFRMAIDRTFTLAGHGTVVTGSVVSGQAAVGEELVIQPDDIRVRVRSLQNHDRAVESVQRGQRAAINLTGIHHHETRRGHELSASQFLQPSRIITVRLQMLPEIPKPLRDRQRVRLHVGTAELLSTVRLLSADQLDAGETGFGQIFLSEAAVTTWNQPFVIRSESPVTSIGGGQVIQPVAERLRRVDDNDLAIIAQQLNGTPVERAAAALYFAGNRSWDPNELPLTAGVDDVEETAAELRQSGDLVEVAVSPTRQVRVHRQILTRIEQRIEAALNGLHDQNPLRSMLDLQVVRLGFGYLFDTVVFDAAIQSMQSEKRIRVSPRGIALVGRGPQLTQNERKLLNQIVDWYRQAGLEPPTIQQCEAKATKNRSSVEQLVKLAAVNGDLVEVADGLYLHADTESQVREKLEDLMSAGSGASMSEIRDSLQTTRKYAVPICEYLDRIEFTRRDGDLRYLVTAGAVSGDGED